jgi:hypothetical protein
MVSRAIGCFAMVGVLAAVDARAQSTTGTSERRWGVEAALGWDNSVSGNVHSAGIGTVNGLPTVVEQRSYDEIYGTGIQWRFGAGYMIDDHQEVIGRFTIQSVSSDAVRLGSIGTSDLVGVFDDYNSFALEGGYRYHFDTNVERLRPYGSALLGVAVIDEIDVVLAAPALNLTLDATDFYDGTAAFSIAFEGGVLYGITDQVDVNASLGLRYVSGLSEIDGLQGTGLEDINDDSGRWTLPLMFGVRFRF